MKRIAILFLGAVLALSCKEVQDSRFFAPELEFSAATYSVTEVPDGVDVKLTLSRPAATAFSARLVFSGTLQEGLQYTVPSHSIDVPAGASEASVHITLIDDEIWEPGYIAITLAPGSRYTVNPSGNCEARVEVTKHVVIPVLRLSVPEDGDTVNPYCAAPVTLTLIADKAPLSDITVPLSSEGFVAGQDFLLDGQADANLTLAAGATSATAMLQVLKKDQSGYDKQLTLGMTAQKGVYGVSSEGSSVSIRLYDPVVDFSPLWKITAQEGEGYQVRQAFKKADGTWNGNTAANWTVSSAGSNYLKSLKNISNTYGYPTVAIGLHILRLPDLFPNLRKTSGNAIVDYGRNSNTRGFSAVDSLFRFVLDAGSATEGSVMLDKPRRFTAAVADYSSWVEASWSADSQLTGGDILKSASPLITSWVVVTLEKLEGRFNLADMENTLLLTAWFSCDDPQFMKDVDTDSIHAVQEDGLWKVEYKLWPRN